MPAKGWISIRELPTTGEKTVKEVLTEFQKVWKLCPNCKGNGEVGSEVEEIFEGVSTVKFSDIKPLNEMAKNKDLNGEVVKRIINKLVHGIDKCDKCKGFGFVKNSRKKNGTTT